MKKILIDAFFSQFTSFMSELAALYPEDNDFPLFIETLNMIKFANPMLVVTYVKNEMLPFADKVVARDESFFMNFNYHEKEDVDLNVVEKLKGYISTMSENSKKVVWDYIDILVRLVQKIIEL